MKETGQRDKYKKILYALNELNTPGEARKEAI